jgi:tripartite-type tricarboxylate transporter receptor subunit TctC
MSSMVVVNPGVPVTTPAELVTYARRNPGKIRYGYGNSTGVIAGETLKQALGIDMIAVPYKGNPQALLEVLNGNIEAMIVDLQSGALQIRARQVRPIVTVGPKRSSVFPDVPL